MKFLFKIKTYFPKILHYIINKQAYVKVAAENV